MVRTIRAVVLAVAAWSLLFAPGAAAAADMPQPDRDHVAAAVVAPTLEVDGATLASRPTSIKADPEKRRCHGGASLTAVAVLHAVSGPILDAPRERAVRVAGMHPGSPSRRGPPLN